MSSNLLFLKWIPKLSNFILFYSHGWNWDTIASKPMLIWQMYMDPAVFHTELFADELRESTVTFLNAQSWFSFIKFMWLFVVSHHQRKVGWAEYPCFQALAKAVNLEFPTLSPFHHQTAPPSPFFAVVVVVSHGVILGVLHTSVNHPGNYPASQFYI